MAELLVIRRRRRNRISRILIKDREDPFSVNESEFIKTYKLSKFAAKDLINEIRPFVSLEENKSYPLEIYFLSTLATLGSGTFQRMVVQNSCSKMSQPSLSRGMEHILNAFHKIYPRYVQFPVTLDDLRKTKYHFFSDLGFPNVVGAIDCTHIRIRKPICRDWVIYVDRTSHFSLNIQMVCNSKMQIIDVVPRWSGNTHDAFIWKYSSLRELIRTRIPENNFLLGDSGYPLEPWLLTPYLNPSSPAEDIFNQKHIKCRNVIERCFGLLKSRFRSIDQSGGILCYAPEKVCKIVIACVILHNICIKYRLEEPSNIQLSDDSETDDSDSDSDDNFQIHSRTARSIRDRIAHQFQTQR